MRFITFFLGIVALLVAANSAYFSITGLSQLFAGAAWAIIAMAGSLEASKLVIAAFLYKQWGEIKWLLKTYMTVALIVLVVISSIGIYGFLTAAYQATADRLNVMDRQIELVETRKERYETQLADFRLEQERLTATINDLNRGLAEGTTIQYIDQETGQLVTTTSAAARRSVESQLADTHEQRDIIRTRMEAANDSILAYEMQIIDIRESSDVAAEIGPLRYLSEVTGRPMNQVVNWLSILIMIVFDPLGIALVIAFTMSATIDRRRRVKRKLERGDYEVYGDKKKPDIEKPEPEPEPTKEPEPEIETPEPKPIVDGQKYKPETHKQIVVQKTEPKKPKLDNPIKKKKLRIPVSIDGDGIIDGYDTTGDGLINEYDPYSTTRYNYIKDRQPYYTKKDFDWSKKQEWQTDKNAVNYFNKHIKSRYPMDFHTKTY